MIGRIVARLRGALVARMATSDIGPEDFVHQMTRTGIYRARDFADAPLVHDDVDACYPFAFQTINK